ncbi:hypothetical protein TIFTF001_039514 [Ficus carica]|uniref:Uncharacterized protein n=1 Tax=Ficus carica TaxID=3494 RepID=A0AA88EAX9_FICCA|nr:hypothetical protein TIFTF001_039498 [Ficus carica]GMN70469.1 hypothetical protein TIFTF001_039514 [Ficus carica]
MRISLIKSRELGHPQLSSGFQLLSYPNAPDHLTLISVANDRAVAIINLGFPGDLRHERQVQLGQAGSGQGETGLHIPHALVVFSKKPSFKLSALVVGDRLLSGQIESSGKYLLELAGVLRTRCGQLVLSLLLSLLGFQRVLLRLLGFFGSNLLGVFLLLDVSD